VGVNFAFSPAVETAGYFHARLRRRLFLSKVEFLQSEWIVDDDKFH
jgi:hypothetical protein